MWPLRTRILFAITLLTLPGCKQEPAVTVTIEISGINNETDKEDALEALKGLTDGSSHQYFSTTSGDHMTIKLSPVSDVKAFAGKINFGKVTEIDAAARTVKVDFGK